MKTARTASIIFGGLLFCFSVSATFAEQADWQKATAAAKVARQNGNYSDAVALYKQALEIQERKMGPNSTEVASTLNNLAVVYQDESKDADAEPLYRRSLQIWEKLRGTNKQVAVSLGNLAALYHDEGKDGEAVSLYNRALAILEKIGQMESPTAVPALAGLGDILYSQGNFSDATPLYKRALAICKKRRGNRIAPMRPLPLFTWRISSVPRASTIKPSLFTIAPWQFGKRPAMRRTPNWPPLSAAWEIFTDSRESMLKPSRFL
jgi:tetratricopeptide (TPR) repeat protein